MENLKAATLVNVFNDKLLFLDEDLNVHYLELSKHRYLDKSILRDGSLFWLSFNYSKDNFRIKDIQTIYEYKQFSGEEINE